MNDKRESFTFCHRYAQYENIPGCIPQVPLPSRERASTSLHISGTLNVMVACGPYTLSESNDPSLLLTLLRAVKKNRPHVLIMIGPFVDCQHSAVQAYHDSTYEELFHTRINSVAEYCSHLDVHLVIVPSWREMHHDPVYPTPPFDQSWTQQTPELLATNTLISKSIWFSRETQVNLSFMMFCNSMWCTQAALCFSWYDTRNIADVKGVLCINPGHVSRGQSSGSYAVLTIHKEPLDVAGETDPKQQISTPLSIARRASAAVMREREFTDRKVRGSNLTSACRIPLSRLGRPGSIPPLVPPSGMAAKRRKGAAAERFFFNAFWISLTVAVVVIDELMRRTLEGLQNPGVQIACEDNLVDLEYADAI
ncbi:LOW QUALITY PROTEIN: hypothetical protein T265_13936, partial [Opisthorchis viverrini]